MTVVAAGMATVGVLVFAWGLLADIRSKPRSRRRNRRRD